MSANGYEIRMGLLGMAKDMLFEGWHQAVDASRHNASLTNSAVQAVPAPSFAELETLANQLYGFVQKNSRAPQQASSASTPEVDLRNPSLSVDFFGGT